MTKSLIAIGAIAASCVLSTAAFAQTSAPVTRASVNAQLVQLEKVGYNPASVSDTQYPADIQAADARIDGQTVNGFQSAGASMNGSSQSGTRHAYMNSVQDSFAQFRP